MQANKIEAGKVYEVTVGKNSTTMRVIEVQRRINGQLVFDCVNVKTNKRATVSDAKRFIKEIKSEKSNPIGKAAKKIIDALGIGPGSAKAKEEAKAAQPESETKTPSKKSLKEAIESKGITVIPKGRRATSTMRDLDDPTFTRKHHVDENGVLILEAEGDEENTESKKERGKGGKPSGKMSALDAAHEILKEQNREMNVKEITELAIASGRWSPNGKTPVSTLSAAVQMDIIKKGDASRFVKAGRGLFAAR